MTRTRFRPALAALALLGLAALASVAPRLEQVLFAQATLQTTTLSAAVTASGTGTSTITVASATGFAAGRTVVIDREAMLVLPSYVSGTTIPVQRGVAGTAAAAHATTTTVYVGPANYFTQNPQEPVGPCTATSEVALPRVVLPSGRVYNCVASTWMEIGTRTNAIYVTCRALLIADMIDQSCFTADRRYFIANITEVHTTAESAGTLTLIPRKQTTTQAPASGAALATAIDMVGAGAVAQTVKTAALTATTTALYLDTGNRLGLDFTDDVAGELAGVVVTFTLIPQ